MWSQSTLRYVPVERSYWWVEPLGLRKGARGSTGIQNHLKSIRTGVASQLMMLHRLQGLHYVAERTWTASPYRSQYDLLRVLALTDTILNTNDLEAGKKDKNPEYIRLSRQTPGAHTSYRLRGFKTVKDCGCGPFFRTRGDASSVLADILYCNDAG